MKIMLASDIHGSAYHRRKMLDIYNESGAGRLATLGDILYHGPRNDLPREYAPKEVIAILDPLKDQIYAIRGNCDMEVGQMVLESPIMTNYGLMVLEGRASYATHGHVHNQDHLLLLWDGDIPVHGYTHTLKVETTEAEGGRHIAVSNPGFVSILKGGNPSTYAMLEDEAFSIRTLEGEVVKELKL